MYQITRGYKQGRAVLYYDVVDPVENKTTEMVPKDNIVKMCTDGQISNAKIQWWEGKPIVRCENKQLPLVRVDENGNIIGVATQAVRSGERAQRSSQTSTQRSAREAVISVADKAVEVGKVSTRRPKRNIVYGGYDPKNVLEQQDLSRTIDLSGLRTVGDMFEYIAKDFRVQQVEKYKAEFGKKVKLDKELSGIGTAQLRAIQYGAATYLMNMLYDEIAEVYMKWQ